MIKNAILAAATGALMLTACQSGSNANIAKQVAAETVGTVNPYLWRASLDTMAALPLVSSDSVGGVIVYDWKAFDGTPNERIKATVYILDTRLRADGVKVSVFRQENQGGTWVDVSVDPETGIQLENKILERARSLKASQLN